MSESDQNLNMNTVSVAPKKSLVMRLLSLLIIAAGIAAYGVCGTKKNIGYAAVIVAYYCGWYRGILCLGAE